MLGAAASAAPASTVACKAGEFGGVDTSEFPVFYKLRAHDLPHRTDGVASRCRVADAVAGEVQAGWDDKTSTFPGEVYPTGDDWDGGTWICVYHEKQGEYVPYMTAKCHLKGKRRRQVTFEMGS